MTPHLAPANPTPQHWPDLSTIVRHASTVLVGQLAVMAFGITDTIVAGRHAEASLAALSVASAIFISISVGLVGILQALLPVWAELRGARQNERLGPSFRQALYLGLLASALGAGLLQHPAPLLAAAQVPLLLHPIVSDYLGVLALALPATLLFRLFSILNQAIGHPRLITWIQVLALPLKVLLSVWWTFGGLGVPALGAVGCAWATLAVYGCMLGLALWLSRTQEIYQPLQLWQRMERPDIRQLGQFLRLGVPAGLTVLVEVTSFTLMALFIARQGTTAAGAHQIAANLAAVLYMVPLSLAIAASARISFWRGAGNEARARQAALTGFALTTLMACVLAAVLWAFKSTVASLYSEHPPVMALGAVLLGWVAIYHLVDAAQCFCLFALRCYGITVAPLAVYSLLLWGAGLGGGYALSYHGMGTWTAQPSPATFWISSAVALALCAVAFAMMLWHCLNRWGRATACPPT
ncbi:MULTISPECIES: MATE family efflux transporter [Giesbergeria]|uniref:MATE family efflux transporter n=1 Tax=Giesbergeria sinuosa TaxID=80883 RepID=A0ABV9QJ46_9BURK